MKITSKTTQKVLPTSDKAASAGPNGIAIAPPSYGITGLDCAPSEAAPKPAPERSAGTLTQMKAGMAASGRDAGSGTQNPTGLPDALKTGVESLSGLAMEDVRVHYNSSKPAQLQALAYTQGTDIHVSPGQERHLPHEAWHVVQQKQGRVKPNMTIKGMAINNSNALEQEADEKAKTSDLRPASKEKPILLKEQTQSKNVVQRKVGFEFQTNIGTGIADKGTPIFAGNRWTAEGDEGDLEFITEPFNEEGPQHEGKQMVTAVGEIAKMAKTINQLGRERGYGGKPIPLKALGKYGKSIPYKSKDVELDIGGWALVGVSSTPQVTGGVSLGNIGKLLDQTLSTVLPVNEDITEGVPFEEPKKRDPRTATAGGDNFARYRVFFDQAKNLAFNELLHFRLELLKLDGDPLTPAERGRVEGFLTYLFLYLLLGANQGSTVNQTKYVFALMSRISFSAMFKALPDAYKILGYFPNEILERSGLGDGQLFKEGMKVGSAPKYAGPTREEWLTSIEEGRDLLSSALSDNPMVEDKGFGSPALGKYNKLESDVKDGVLIEIRSLPREVIPDYWVPMAIELFKMFRRIQG